MRRCRYVFWRPTNTLARNEEAGEGPGFLISS
jgi:hypothetical protein